MNRFPELEANACKVFQAINKQINQAREIQMQQQITETDHIIHDVSPEWNDYLQPLTLRIYWVRENLTISLKKIFYYMLLLTNVHVFPPILIKQKYTKKSSVSLLIIWNNQHILPVELFARLQTVIILSSTKSSSHATLYYRHNCRLAAKKLTLVENEFIMIHQLHETQL